MIVLGLDIASKTGWAAYDTAQPVSAIETGTLKCEGKAPEEKAADLARLFDALLLRLAQSGRKADLICFEQPIRVPAGRNGSASFASAQALAGAVSAVCGVRGKQWRSIPISTWRKGFLGAGRVSGRDRRGWKQAAIERCRLLNIAVKGDDAAEAVGIAFYGAGIAQTDI